MDSKEDIDSVYESLGVLSEQSVFDQKYGVSGKGAAFAMGDGNHSLATAKNIWEDLKSRADNPGDVMDHPARYALVELMNVHDEGLEFEPIHRVIFKIDVEDLLKELEAFFSEEGSSVTLEKFETFEAVQDRIANLGESDQEHRIAFVASTGFGLIRLSNPKRNLEVGNLQAFIDNYVEGRESVVDYIHGDDVVIDLGSKLSNIGFFLPTIGKSALFKTVVLDGALPRKTFSMGGGGRETLLSRKARRIQ